MTFGNQGLFVHVGRRSCQVLLMQSVSRHPSTTNTRGNCVWGRWPVSDGLSQRAPLLTPVHRGHALQPEQACGPLPTPLQLTEST